MLKRVALSGALALALISSAAAQSANPIVQGAVTCTGSLQQLPAYALSQGALVIADDANTGTVYVGGPSVTASGSTQPYGLTAGKAKSWKI